MRILGLLVTILFIGCQSEVSVPSNVVNKLTIRQKYLDSNYHSYAHIRDAALDSLQSYKSDSLMYVKGLFFDEDWTIDSILIFNSDHTRFYGKLLSNQSLPRDKEIDAIVDFGGALIDSSWYYFMMGTSTVVPRGDYHHDPYEPLTFEELSYIAWRRAIPGLIYRRRDGSIATDHKAIDRMFCETGRTICPDKETACVCNDSMTVAQGRHRRQFKLTKEDILKIQQEIRNSKKPYVPPYKELTWWDRVWGKEEKLFDSKAWRDRYNYKSEEDEG